MLLQGQSTEGAELGTKLFTLNHGSMDRLFSNLMERIFYLIRYIHQIPNYTFISIRFLYKYDIDLLIDN